MSLTVDDQLLACESVPGYANRKMLRRLYNCAKDAKGKGGALEIGCLFGRTTIAIALGLAEVTDKLLMCIDPFESWPGEDALKSYQDQFRDDYANLAEFFMANVDDAGCKVDLIVGKSQDKSIQHQVRGKLRFAFIDGDHRLEQAKADCEWVMSKMAIGGIVAVDDYGHNRHAWGVEAACKEFIEPRSELMYDDEPQAGCVFFRVVK